MAQIQFQAWRFMEMSETERKFYLKAIKDEMAKGDTLRFGIEIFNDFESFMDIFDRFDDLDTIIDFYNVM